jgi:hypothetical protein
VKSAPEHFVEHAQVIENFQSSWRDAEGFAIVLPFRLALQDLVRDSPSSQFAP